MCIRDRCSDGAHAADNGVILMAQSVPTATWVPCISNALPLGWQFHHLDARNGVARFWLDSDRDGQHGDGGSASRPHSGCPSMLMAIIRPRNAPNRVAIVSITRRQLHSWMRTGGSR